MVRATLRCPRWCWTGQLALSRSRTAICCDSCRNNRTRCPMRHGAAHGDPPWALCPAPWRNGQPLCKAAQGPASTSTLGERECREWESRRGRASAAPEPGAAPAAKVPGCGTHSPEEGLACLRRGQRTVPPSGGSRFSREGPCCAATPVAPMTPQPTPESRTAAAALDEGRTCTGSDGGTEPGFLTEQASCCSAAGTCWLVAAPVTRDLGAVQGGWLLSQTHRPHLRRGGIPESGTSRPEAPDGHTAPQALASAGGAFRGIRAQWLELSTSLNQPPARVTGVRPPLSQVLRPCPEPVRMAQSSCVPALCNNPLKERAF